MSKIKVISNSTLDSYPKSIKTIHIPTVISAYKLKEDLEMIAQNYVLNPFILVGSIYEYAVKNQFLFQSPLKNPRKQSGEHIGTTVPAQVALELEIWAKNSTPRRSRGRLCCYILQKTLEDDLIKKSFEAFKFPKMYCSFLLFC